MNFMKMPRSSPKKGSVEGLALAEIIFRRSKAKEQEKEGRRRQRKAKNKPKKAQAQDDLTCGLCSGALRFNALILAFFGPQGIYLLSGSPARGRFLHMSFAADLFFLGGLFPNS